MRGPDLARQPFKSWEKSSLFFYGELISISHRPVKAILKSLQPLETLHSYTLPSLSTEPSDEHIPSYMHLNLL